MKKQLIEHNIIKNPSEMAEELALEAHNIMSKADALQNSLKRFKPKKLNSFSQLIKNQRLTLGLNIEDVASLSDVHASTYQKIESGKTSPRLETVERICQTLGLNLCVI